MRYSSAVALRQVATQQSAHNRKRGSANHEPNTRGKHPKKVWDKEDDDPGVH
jgi:hypothetical protein